MEPIEKIVIAEQFPEVTKLEWLWLSQTMRYLTTDGITRWYVMANVKGEGFTLRKTVAGAPLLAEQFASFAELENRVTQDGE